jgi:hypothetical protein
MESGSATSSFAREVGDGDHRADWLKYILMIFTLVSEGLVSFFEYLARGLSDGFLYLFVACSLILFFMCIGALVRRRWKDLVLISAALGIAYVPLLGIRGT